MDAETQEGRSSLPESTQLITGRISFATQSRARVYFPNESRKVDMLYQTSLLIFWFVKIIKKKKDSGRR